MSTGEIKLCECGCGSPAPIAKRTRSEDGVVKGETIRFISGHNGRKQIVVSYRTVAVGGKQKLVHILKAEKALGRPLPSGAKVHHADGDIHNNDNSNLVICQDHAYHKLLHVRMVAKAVTGDPRKRKCKFCKKWDDAGNLKTELAGAGKVKRFHVDCRILHDKERYAKTPALHYHPRPALVCVAKKSISVLIRPPARPGVTLLPLGRAK